MRDEISLPDACEMIQKRSPDDAPPVMIGRAFVVEARRSFGFLEDLGFSWRQAEPTLVRYEKGDVGVHVYLGRRSYELGFEVLLGGVTYSLHAIMRASDPVAASEYRKYAVSTADGLLKGLEKLAATVKTHADRALRGERAFFKLLDEQTTFWSHEFALDVLAEQVRPLARLAFHRREYAKVVELYQSILPRLTPAELKMLDISRKRSPLPG